MRPLYNPTRFHQNSLKAFRAVKLTDRHKYKTLPKTKPPCWRNESDQWMNESKWTKKSLITFPKNLICCSWGIFSPFCLAPTSTREAEHSEVRFSLMNFNSEVFNVKHKNFHLWCKKFQQRSFFFAFASSCISPENFTTSIFSRYCILLQNLHRK